MKKPPQPAPRETAFPRRLPLGLHSLVLRIVVVIQCFGVGGRYLFSSMETESDVYGWLYFDCHWSESLAQSIDNAGALMTLVAGGLLCLTGWRMTKPMNESPRDEILRRLDRAAAWWVALWMLLNTAAHMMRAAVFAELSLAEHAVRYAAPIALALFSGARDRAPGGTGHVNDSDTGDLFGEHATKVAPKLDVDTRAFSQPRRTRVAIHILVVAAAFTFAAHGYKAFECYAPFTDLILLSDMQWTDTGCTQTTAEQLLVAIGIADIVVALALLLIRSRLAAFYMVVWGSVTAASRMTAFGFDAWPETLIRIANGGVPLAILIYWMTIRKPVAPTSSS